MITILSSTNRPESRTLFVSRHYLRLLEGLGVPGQLLSLTDLPPDFIHDDLYGKRSEVLAEMVERYIGQAAKFVFVIPEYQGSFPGVLKTFLDGIHPRLFRDKKAGMIGVSDGHAGNLRGQEHLTGILHYLKMHVHYNKPKLSSIDKLIDAQNQITDERTLKLLADHAAMMAKF